MRAQQLEDVIHDTLRQLLHTVHLGLPTAATATKKRHRLRLAASATGTGTGRHGGVELQRLDERGRRCRRPTFLLQPNGQLEQALRFHVAGVAGIGVRAARF